MSDRLVLAEFGTGLCIAALALAGMPVAATTAAVAVPAVVLWQWLDGFQGRSDKAVLKAAEAGALKALDDNRDLTKEDIHLARLYLERRRQEIKVNPGAMARQARSGNLAGALFNVVTESEDPPTPGAATVVRLTLEAVYAVCRIKDDYHVIFTQEVLFDLCKQQGIILERIEGIKSYVSEGLNNDQIILEGISDIKSFMSGPFQSSMDPAAVVNNEQLANARFFLEISDQGLSVTEVTKFLKLINFLDVSIAKAGEIISLWKKND